MIAGLISIEDAADEPVWTAVEQRHARGSFVPLDLCELVDLISRLASEELGEVPIVG